MMHQFIRTSFEAVLWVFALSLVVTLAGCDEQENQPGSKQECVLTAQGEICRTPEGISRK